MSWSPLLLPPESGIRRSGFEITSERINIDATAALVASIDAELLRTATLTDVHEHPLDAGLVKILKKIEDLTAAGLSDITPVKHVFGVTDANRRYLSAKQDWGHRLSKEDISES